MTLLLSGLWPGLAGALLLGLAVGRLTGMPRAVALGLGLGTAAACLAGVAVAGLVPGRAGLWVDSAALMLGVYLGGCLCGATARRLGARRPSAET
ncbi:hypothetical protein [Methylobacterium nigriterrae]|uniref:hypothetical protein n=1 Tax=Methylobacterium nigriterrae TaxID=3127512 RepID=UPI003013F4A9